MTIFSGTDTQNMDTKGRLAIPARLRADLVDLSQAEDPAQRIVLTVSPNAKRECLVGYTVAEWEALLAMLGELPNTDDVQTLKDRLVFNAKQLELDKQGRMLVPSELREPLGMAGPVRVVGAIKKIEFWTPDAHAAHLQRSQQVDLTQLLNTLAL